MGAQGQRPLAPPPFATRGGYTRRKLPLTLSLSLSLSRSIQLTLQHVIITTTKKVCALSHIYTYMTFGLFTQMSTPIGRTDRNRFLDQPVLSIFHPEGHVSQHSCGTLSPAHGYRSHCISSCHSFHASGIHWLCSLLTPNPQHPLLT